MTVKLEVGQPIPIFSVRDSTGNEICPDLLFGHPYVLYFYPQDDTPGCSKEACQFRDTKSQFDDFNAKVIGISPNSIVSHDQFIHKYALNFSLVSDPYYELCALFGVWKEEKNVGQTKWSVTRATFIIDTNGIICWIEKPVKVQKHAERVLNALKTAFIKHDNNSY